MTGHKKHDTDDEIVFESEENAGSTLKPKSEAKVKEELKACQKEKQEYLEGWQRAKADLINYKREAEESRKKFAQFAAEDIIAQLLPVLDSFDMAFRNKTAWETAPPEWRHGVEHIYSQLLGVLQTNGVMQINPLGETFDPTRHESLETVHVSDASQEGTVVDVVQKGYALNGRLIRAARVKTGEFKK